MNPGAVTLRAVEPADLPIFFAHQLEPEAIRMAAFPSRAHGAFMAHWQKNMLPGGPILRTILFKGSVAGNIVCWERDGEHNLGYWIGRDHWSQGIASAALPLFLAEIPHRPVVAHVAKHNTRSLRVLQKAGFKTQREEKSAGADGIEIEEYILIFQ
jgi:RimJ/RimL family protein N-acetyltransferase